MTFKSKLITERQDHACAKIKVGNNFHIVVTGGWYFEDKGHVIPTEIYSVQDDIWQAGKFLHLDLVIFDELES